MVNDATGRQTLKALVLSGGGARGAYEAGVIAGLHTKGEQFDIICGTSIGAINGSLVAQGRFDGLAALWHAIGSRGIITPIPQVLSLLHLWADVLGILHDPILKWPGNIVKAYRDFKQLGPPAGLEKILGGLETAPVISILSENLNLEQLNAALIVSATNLTRSTSDVFYRFPDFMSTQQTHFLSEQSSTYPITPETYAEIVRASAAIPAAFPPVAITAPTSPQQQSFLYVDGGVANNTPIGLAIDAGASEVTIIFMDPDEGITQAQPIQNLIEVGYACFSVMQQKILASDLQTAINVNNATKAGGDTQHKVVRLRTVRPVSVLPLSVLEFSNQGLLNAAYSSGVSDASNQLKVISE